MQNRCAATAKSGQPCQSFALPGRATCYMHTEELAGERLAAQAKGGATASKLRVLKGKRAKLDTAPALIRFCAGVIQDVLHGALPPDVGRVVLYGLSIQKSLVEVGDLEARIAALEKEARR